MKLPAVSVIHVAAASALVLTGGGLAFARQLPRRRARYGWIAKRGST